MLPFCGYNMAQHWKHWLELGHKHNNKAPKILGLIGLEKMRMEILFGLVLERI